MSKEAITDRKIYVSLITLLGKDNEILLEHINLGLKDTIIWYKPLIKAAMLEQNQYINLLIDLSF